MRASHLHRRVGSGALALLAGLAVAACGASSSTSSAGGATTTGTGTSPAPAAAATSTAPLGQRPLPAFLPRPGPADGRLEASPDRAALAFQGEGVLVHVGPATVVATVVGPSVPLGGGGASPTDIRCTWVVTLTGASARLPLSIEQWSVRDSLGRTTQPTVAPGSAPLPQAIEPGQEVRVGITATERVGEGLVQWIPQGTTPEVQWDYIAEVN